MAYVKHPRRGASGRTREPGGGLPSQGLVLAVVWLSAVMLTVFGLPGGVLLPVGYGVARLAGRGPDYAGRDAWKRPCPGSRRQWAQERSWRRLCRYWTRPALVVRDPILVTGLGVGFVSAVRIQVWWMAVMHAMGVAWWLGMHAMAVAVDARTPVVVRPVAWSKPMVWRSLATLVVALAAGVPLAVWVGALWPLGVALVAAGVVARRGPARMAHVDAGVRRDMWLMVDRWLQGMERPPVMPPVMVRGVRAGERTMLVRFTVREGVRAWVDGKLAVRVAAGAQADGWRVAFTPAPGSERDVDMVLVPLETPDYRLIPLGDMRAWLMWDVALTGTQWHSFAPTVTGFRRVSTPDSGAGVWRFTLSFIDGTGMGVVERDWLQGADTDLGCHMHALVMADPAGSGVCWLLPDDWRQDPRIHVDDREGLRGVDHSFSATGSLLDYLSLTVRMKRDRRTWLNALDGVRGLMPPIIKYDTVTGVDGTGGWSVEAVQANAPQGCSASRYALVDLRATFGDARIADLLPLRTERGWSDRMMLFVHDLTGVPPVRVDGVTGMMPGDVLVLQVIVQHALTAVYGRLMYVDRPVPLTMRTGVWRVRVELPEGVTPADVQAKASRVQGALGCVFTLVEWDGLGAFRLWFGNMPGMESPKGWRDDRDRRLLVRLRMEQAWLASKVTGVDGSSLTVRAVAAQPGGMLQVDFLLPQGVGSDRAIGRLDGFKTAAGFRYARVLDAPDAKTLRLLLGVDEPLPVSVDADWTLMADRSQVRRLPFGVTDRGGVAVFDVDVSPHLMVSGTSGAGKSSVGQVLACDAVLKGWDLLVCDAEKGANDFLALKPYARGFATDLEHVYAMVEWTWREMKRRAMLLKSRGVNNVRDLPDGTGVRMLMLLVDEFNSLVGAPKRVMPNRGDDPSVTNMNLRIQWENMMRQRIGAHVCELAAQGRSAGIMLLLLGQSFTGDALAGVPDPSGLKRNLARLFIGQGEAAGNVSTANVQNANRLIRSFGTMPKGRGVFELLGRGVDGVQCWYSGGGMAMATHLEGLSPAGPLDVSGLLPAKPKQVGVVDDPVDDDGGEPVVVRDGFGSFF